VVLSAAEDGAVWLWDLDHGNPVAESLDVGYTVRAFSALAVDSAGLLVAFAAPDSGVRLYRVPDDAAGGFALQEWGHLPTTHRAVNALCSVSVSGAGTFFATAGSEGAVQLWDPLTQDTWGDELDVGEEINAMGRIPVSGRDLLAIGTNGDDEALLLWDPETGATRHLAGAPPWVSAVCAVPGPGGPTLAAGSKDGSLALWDPVSGVPLSLTQRTGSVIWAIGTPATSTGRTLIATAGESYRVRLWHPVTLEPVHDIDLRTTVFGMAAVGPALVLAAHTGVIVLHLHDHLFPPAA
jgi:WD40 repeat protein